MIWLNIYQPLYRALYRAYQETTGGGGSPGDSLLLETGDYLLLESGDKLLLE